MHPAQLARERERRLHRFGLIAGLLLALLFHVLIFWGPRVSYRPVLEQAQVKRVIVARPYQPPPPPPPPKKVVKRPAPAPAKAKPKVAKAPVDAPSPAPTLMKETVAPVPDKSFAKAGGGAKRGALDTQRDLTPSEWEQLLKELEKEHQELDKDAGTWDVAEAGQEASQSEEWEEGDVFLDPRIRVKVVSYPPSNIERFHPPIPFPNVRVSKKQMDKGICRVWYRVWIDGRGKVVRDQIKTPTDKVELKEYGAYVDMVVEEVNSWAFDRMEAEIHVDVLFDLKNLD